MKFRFPLRTVIGLSGILLLGVYGWIEAYSQAAVKEDPYHIAALQQRFEVLAQDVPPDTTLGYISDVAPDEATIYGLQYVLAPRFIVKDSRPHRLVLGNFHQPTDYAEFGREHGLLLIKEYPQSVVLFEKAPR